MKTVGLYVTRTVHVPIYHQNINENSSIRYKSHKMQFMTSIKLVHVSAPSAICRECTRIKGYASKTLIRYCSAFTVIIWTRSVWITKTEADVVSVLQTHINGCELVVLEEAHCHGLNITALQIYACRL